MRGSASLDGSVVGFGFWQRLPTGWWFVELAVIAVLWFYCRRRSAGARSFGRRPFAVAGALLALHAFNSPWLSQL